MRRAFSFNSSFSLTKRELLVALRLARDTLEAALFLMRRCFILSTRTGLELVLVVGEGVGEGRELDISWSVAEEEEQLAAGLGLSDRSSSTIEVASYEPRREGMSVNSERKGLSRGAVEGVHSSERPCRHMSRKVVSNGSTPGGREGKRSVGERWNEQRSTQTK